MGKKFPAKKLEKILEKKGVVEKMEKNAFKKNVFIIGFALIVSAMLTIGYAQTVFAETEVTPSQVQIEQNSYIFSEGTVLDNVRALINGTCTEAKIRLESIAQNSPDNADITAKFSLLNKNDEVIAMASAGNGTNLTAAFNNNPGIYLFDNYKVQILVAIETGKVQVSLQITRSNESCSTPIPQPADIYVKLNEKFDLLLNQKAIVAGENLDIRLDKIVITQCPPGIYCMVIKPYLYFTATKQPTGSETGVSSQMQLGLGEKTSIFGYTIENTGIIEEGTARFIITKNTTTNPSDISAKFGEKFSIIEGQTARFYEDGKETAKMRVEKISPNPNISNCTAGQPCATTMIGFQKYVSFTFSDSSGSSNYTIYDSGKIEVLGKYTVYLSEIQYSYGADALPRAVFFVEKNSQINIVKLGENFNLNLNQAAEVSGTGIQLQFMDWSQIYCIKAPCPSGTATFLVTAQFPQAKDEKINQAGMQTKISLVEGNSQDVFGYSIKLNKLYTNSTENNTATANLTVTNSNGQPQPPNIIKANLDEKFKLAEKQWGYILDNTGQTIAKMNLDAISQYSCPNMSGSGNEKPEQKCYSSPFATINISIASGGNSTLTLTEGEERQISGYSVRLLDIDVQNKIGVFVVSKAYSGNTIKVSLNEKFGLAQQDTAFVVGPDFFIKLQGISLLKSNPPQYIASISAWKNYENTGTGTDIKLQERETASIFGAKITAVELSDSKATFIVAQENGNQIINVYTDDPFWLKEGQSAQVIPTNMLIELLGIDYSVACPTVPPAGNQDISTIDRQLPCRNDSKVKIGVSNSMFESVIGTAVSSQEVQNSVVQSETETQKMKIEKLPPLPFEVFTLSQGEEITVGDYTIKVLSIQPDSAEFVVNSKPSGFEANYKIYSGWNLFSMPGDLKTVSSTCNTSNWKIFEYNNESKKFKKVSNPKPAHAYWVYNPNENCSVQAQVINPASIKDIMPLKTGWNFVPVTVDMVGKQFSGMGNCQIAVSYKWDAAGKQWVKALFGVMKTDIGSAYAVYSNNNCQLWKEDDGLSPPPLPPIEGNDLAKIAFYPKQCEATPWQASTTNSQDKAIKNYYKTLGVKIIETSTVQSGTTTCMACGCPAGYYITATVNKPDVEKMLSLGWQKA